jgi:spore maturation protein CgeB
MALPRILYIGELYEGATCLDRMRSIESFGYEVVPFNTEPYTRGGVRVIQSLGWRFNIGPMISRFNEALCKLVVKLNEVTYVWIDKGVWVWPETVEKIKKHTGAVLIHFTPDPAILFHRSRHFFKSIPYYDILFTTKAFEIELYRGLGAPKVCLTYQAFEESRFYPRCPERSYGSDITFIGHHERHYANRIKQCSKVNNIEMKIWGPRWPRYAKFARWCKPYIQGRGIWGDEYPKAISSAKICLALLSKLIPETTTTRTFEIPACGTFMLAERTDEHLALFKEGKEADFFSSDEELYDKVKYYLFNPDERRRIAAAGRERCLKSGYSNHDRLKQMLNIIDNL